MVNAVDVLRRTDRDDHVGVVMRGEDQRQVSGGIGQRREGHGANAEVLNALKTHRVPVRVSGQNHATGGPQRLGVDVLRITDDVVRLILQVEERVGTCIDADEQRLVLADEVL